MITGRALAEYIDHTLLRPEATEKEVAVLCEEAIRHGFKSVCVESRWLPFVVSKLQGTKVMPITVVSFPHGEDPTVKKVADAESAHRAGALEIDMVLNRGLLKRKDYRGVSRDIEAVALAVPVPVKVILETSELTEAEKILACGLAKAAGAAFVKTSTGFAKGGATEADVKLMRSVVGEAMGVKASGGIRTHADAIKMIEAGANRLGASASVAIVKMTDATGSGY